MDGKAAPSKRPIATRATRRAASECLAAVGVVRVETDQPAVAIRSMRFPPTALAPMPPATLNTTYPQKKDESTSPFCLSLHAKSSAIGRMHTETLTRSP